MRPLYALLLFIVCVGVALSRNAPVSGQASGGDECGPVHLTQPLDLRVMQRCFSESNFSAAVESALVDEECTHLSFAFFEESPNGDRDYGGCLLFRSGSSFTKFGPDYTYDHRSGDLPGIPSDRMSFTTTTETGSYSGTAIPDTVCWRFLLHVANENHTPAEICDEFDGKHLKKIWVTRHEGQVDEVVAYFRFGNPDKTWKVIAEHTGSYNFGPLEVRLR